MTEKTPASYRLLFVAIISTAIFLVAYSSIEYAIYVIYLLPIILIAYASTIIGIVMGFRFKTEDTEMQKLNRIGLYGNLALITFFVIEILIETLFF